MSQPSHWTYRSYNAADDLQQGDVIRRSPDLLNMLNGVLSHFCDERYTAFLIVTQSCDLVQRRASQCKAEYINLCVIRELEPLLPTILEPYCGAGIPGVFSSDDRWHAEQLLKKVVNQNDQLHGLFYLHPDEDVKIATPSVALLRVSLALRRDHYGLLQKCRCGRLDAEYATKLGWLTGNLYSRVATPDWEDKENDPTASEKQAKYLLRQISKPHEENWVSRGWLAAAKAANEDLTSIPLERFRSTLEKYAPPDTLDVVLESVKRLGHGVVVDEACDSIGKRLAEHEAFGRSVVLDAVGLLNQFLSDKEQSTLQERLVNDDEFRGHIGTVIASQLKRARRTPGEQVVDTAVEQLMEGLRMPQPATTRFQRILQDVLEPARSDKIHQIAAIINGARLLGTASSKIAVEIACEAFNQLNIAILDKLVLRLRNDQRLAAACREKSKGAAASRHRFD